MSKLYTYPENIRENDFYFIKDQLDSLDTICKQLSFAMIPIVQNEMQLSSEDINEWGDSVASKILEAEKKLEFLSELSAQMIDKFQEV